MASLILELRKCQSESSQLRSSLNRIGREKEECFGNVKALEKEVAEALYRLRACKANRDVLTSSVKKSKLDCMGFMSCLSDLMALYNSLVSQMNARLKAAGNVSPERLSKEVGMIEFRVETGAISFDEELRLMKVLKQKKKMLRELEVLAPVFGDIRLLESAVSDVEGVVRDLRLSIRKNALESQKKHEEMILAAKALDELRAKKREAFGRFVELKKQFSETNARLKEKLLELSALKMRLDEQKKSVVKEEAVKREQLLREKEIELAEKMRKGLKLTTQDLLAFQDK